MRLQLIATTAILLMLIIACAPVQEEATIGVILPLSGNFAQYGKEAKDGMMLALEETNFKAQILYEDSKGDKKEGITAFQKLTDVNNAVVVITGTSPVSMAISPLANEKKILQMAVFSSTPDYTSPQDYTFRVSPRAEIESGTLAAYIKENHDAVGIIYINSDYGKGELKGFKAKLDKNLMAEEAFDEQNPDFRTSLTKLKSKNIDALIAVGDAKSTGTIIKQARELGLNATIYGQRPMQSEELIRIAGPAAEGVIYTYPFDPENKAAQTFTNSFKKRFDYMPTAYSAEGYEAMKILLDGMKICEQDTTCMKNKFTNMQHDSVFGQLNFDDNGDVKYPFTIKTIKEGSFTRLS